MPPIIIWAVGAVGGFAAARILASASRRANADLDAIRRGDIAAKPAERLERDPASGVYRPCSQ